MKNKLILTVIILLSLAGRAQLTTGLIDCWEFNEASGTVATAYNPAYNGTINGATVNQAGKVGKCYDFDGADDLVSIPFTTNYTVISFSAWIYVNTIGETAGRIIDKYAGTLPYEYWIFVSTAPSSKFYITIQRGFSVLNGGWQSAVSYSFNTWYHVAITYDAGSLTNDPIIYINGSSVSITEIATPDGSINSNTSPYYIGNRSAKDRSFDGLIDQPAIWNRMLSQEEVTQLYNAGAGQHFRRKDIHLWTNF